MTSPVASPPSRRALIADDDPTCLLMLEHVLEALGRPFDVADDGAGAWRAWERSRHPLVLLDIEMPGIDGLEVCRRIRQADPKRETFIVVVTARDKAADLEEVLDAGADDYVVKPLNPQHLLSRLRIASRHMLADAARREAEDQLRKARYLAGIGETSVALQHEINNPLAGLLATAELMQIELKDKGQSTEEIAVIIQEAKRIMDLTKRMGALQDPQSVPYFGSRRMIDLGEHS
jgi:DNA-binding response OmpR family regulator